ncbi:MAG: PDDEXK nuclease domain-containing protein [Pyrinomonadaceae bacterium]|jgi:predicted nuclease of restriction endonuclease-like (RecB) superfamily|nr:PDDEXK nuclease domain-containing protein [Pyrinomonadaceae bacterium]
MSEIISQHYTKLLKDIKELVRTTQLQTLKQVNTQLISMYWNIGKMIVERQEGETWGKSIVEQLAKDLRQEFPTMTGLSARSIWYMRNFYLEYYQNEKLPPLVAEIAWTHNRIILDKCKDNLEREFYVRMTRKFGWSKNVLIHRIENKDYERTISSQTNFEQTVTEENRLQAKLAVKDEYLFDFLELGDEYSERQLETALIGKVEKFLREMGGMFTFVGSQFSLQVSDKQYFIDLLLYHRLLKCLVAIELKIGEFQPEFVGKMQFYLAVLNDKVRLPDENPSIGIILCKDKDKTVVEYALQQSVSPIGVAKYVMVSQLPESMLNQLPTVEQISNLLHWID